MWSSDARERPQCLEICPEPEDNRWISLIEEPRNGSEEVDLLENGIATEQVEERTQELRYVEPAEVGGSQGRFGVADREVQIEPIHQEGHPIGPSGASAKEKPHGS